MADPIIYGGPRARAYVERIKSQEIVAAKPRRCVRCGENFSSGGPGNRMCDRCQSSPPLDGFKEKGPKAVDNECEENTDDD